MGSRYHKASSDQTCSRYGLSWDESADTYTRTGILTGVTKGNSPGNVLLPIHSQMKRCVINNAGVVQYYLDNADSTKKADGSASDLTGAAGQVMVEIPAFYYKYSYAGTVHSWEISEISLTGFSLHPAFIKNGANVANRYIGAYEGVLYDTSASIYTDGLYLPAQSTVFTIIANTIMQAGLSNSFTRLQVGDKILVSGTTNNNGTFTVATAGDNTIVVTEALTTETASATIIQTQKDFTATTGDVLASVSGKAPINYGTRPQFRVASVNRGTGWRQQDYDLISAIQLLYLIEYASFYSQSVIGAGLTDWNAAWFGYNNLNPINNTGVSNAKGNTTFNLLNGNGVVGSYMTYRGIENFYGHIWKWVDGINVNNNIPYVSNTDIQFADNTTTNYTDLGITLINADGWQASLEQTRRGFLPASVGASSSTKITDYYYQNTGWRVAALGGYSYNGALAGAFCLDVYDASSSVDRKIGARLAF